MKISWKKIVKSKREEQFLSDLTNFFSHFVLNWRCPKVEFGNDCLHLTKNLLGFLQNMNLTSLIREFEMEAAAASGEGPTFRNFVLSWQYRHWEPFFRTWRPQPPWAKNGNINDSLNDIGINENLLKKKVVKSKREEHYWSDLTENLLNNGKMTDSLMWHWIWMNV